MKLDRSRLLLIVLALSLLAAVGCGDREATGSSSSIATSPPSATGRSAAAPEAVASDIRLASASGGREDGEYDSSAEARELIAAYHSIRLTPEQEQLKVEALSTIPAPCCDKNPLATCCCPCNMAKAAWGLAARLIVEEGAGVSEVREATEDWLRKINPDGFTGDACFTGGCNRSFEHNGCGGMNESRVL